MYPEPGEIIEGKYRIERMLGEGAMGGVFTAFHTLRRANVALKFMSERASIMPESVDRFMNEAVSASQIESDHVVKIFDVGRWGQQPYIVMEFLEGYDLAEEIKVHARTGQEMPVARAVHFTLQILRALQVAHARGIVHRDLKPANAFVITKDDEPDFVKLLDFGISKQTEPGSVHLTKTNVAMGTPLYMAPEQAKSARDVDARSDVYSVACILFELLSGRPPHQAENYNLLLYKLFQEDPPRLETLRRDLPPGLADVVHRGLTKDPGERVQGATELAKLIAPFADERSAALVTRMLGRSGAGAPTTSPATTLATTAITAPSPSKGDPPSVFVTGAPRTITTGSAPDASAPTEPPPAPDHAANVATRPYPPYTVATGTDPDAPVAANSNASTAVAFERGSSPSAVATKRSPMRLVLGGLALLVAVGVGGVLLSRGPRDAPAPTPAAPPTVASTAPAAPVASAPAPESAPPPTSSASASASASPSPSASAVASQATVAAPTAVVTAVKPATTTTNTGKPKTLKGMDIMK